MSFLEKYPICDLSIGMVELHQQWLGGGAGDAGVVS